MKTLWSIEERFFMSRNEFDAAHWCPVEEREVYFTVSIGNAPVCPSCHQIALLGPVCTHIDEGPNTLDLSNPPQEAEETEEL